MDKKIIDARGLSCPQPVIAAKKAVDAGEPLDILLDCQVYRENVLSFAAHSGWRKYIHEEVADIILSFKKEQGV
jgi:TusA-related sulfurtransferase